MVWGIKDEYFEKVYPKQVRRQKVKQDEEEAERNKASLKWWYMKYHPNCEIDGHAAALSTRKRVVFTDNGCVTICDECYERLHVDAMYVIERPHKRGVLLPLPLAPTMAAEQSEMDLGGC